jgi:probable phosphoglycerate mutase
MTTLLLIRHALNDLVDQAIAGWRPGTHLNAVGRAQAARLAEVLAEAPLRALYSSPLERARETAAPLAARLGLAVTTDTELGEIDFGDWTGRSLAELAADERWRAFNSLRSLTRVPGGELMIETQARMITALERLRARHPAEMIAVFSHGDPIRAALAYYLGLHLDLFQRFEISPASVSLVEFKDNGPLIQGLNITY